MKIRLARDEDYSAMARLRRQTIRNVNSKDYPESIIRNWSATGGAQSFGESANQYKRWVALDKDKIIGFSEYNLKGEISRIYIHKDFLRKGAGSALLKMAEESLEKLGFKEISIESTITAKDFYKKNGYSITEQTVSKWDNATVYKMLKKLP